MNVVIIASVIVVAVALAGMLLATLFVRLSNTVSQSQAAVAKEQSAYNPTLTVGHKIPVEADFEAQLRAAQKEAARRAAAAPRGSNSLYTQGTKETRTAFDGVKDDPLTAVRIASFHGWQFLRGPGAVAGQPVAATAPTAQAAPAMKSPDDLVPGVDYPEIKITDDMDPAEIRKARVANAKAKSAAIKALKEAGGAAAPAAAPAAAAPAPAAAAPTGAVAEPVAGVDYEEIPITDDMDPAEIRKARIANAKAKSAAMKKFKEAGGVVEQVAEAVAAPAATAAAAAAPAAPSPAPAALPASIQPPEYIEITDDMDPADIRKARIANAKAKSAYNKALKEAGIDPSTVDA